MTTPGIEYSALSPQLIVFGVAVVGVLVEAFAPRRIRTTGQPVLSVVGLVAALVAVLASSGDRRVVASGAVAVDGPGLFLQGIILVVATLSVVLFAQRARTVVPARSVAVSATVGGEGGALQSDAFTAQASTVPGSPAEKAASRIGVVQTEVFPLLMFAVGGMMLFAVSNDLLTMFVALEVLSLPLYLLCGLARRRRLQSQEAALKYFLLGAFSSAIFLFGVAFLYGYAGTVRLDGIAAVVRDGSADTMFAVMGVALVAVGLLFKVGAVPFHSWVPDVYQGAPTPVTAFMAAATKVAAFGALLRVLDVAVPGLRDDWRPALWAIAILTMVIGSIATLSQHDVKRILAYSAITHTGFLLAGVGATTADGVSSTMFYLVVYGVSTVGAFTTIGLVRDARTGDASVEASDFTTWTGLGRRSPLVAAVFALFLLALAGIPLTAGFIAKFAVFSAAAGDGGTALVIVGVLCSAIAAIFYVRVIVLMFLTDTPDDATVVVVRPSIGTAAVVGVCAVATVVLGVFPQPLLDLAMRATTFVG
ncbi:NADH-quinone oxidoreductase subunit NuoN [Williamsia sterculiae]|uniref:NADH-quinone oxidoreductase subunit N n=1 Tax=Williamsia sterculiae TaxID=1344003 RepID=A0A1N7F7N8_9NOCA|nr:NADH-quinone oxidoreductase subunit NuoN [Williamsia sterculiae]SIR96357.1 NADH dehydrogenase subunit N [Williamsia sterculiae]